MKNRDGAGDIARLLNVEERADEGLECGCVLEMNGDDAAAAGNVVRRFNALDDGIGVPPAMSSPDSA